MRSGRARESTPARSEVTSVSETSIALPVNSAQTASAAEARTQMLALVVAIIAPATKIAVACVAATKAPVTVGVSTILFVNGKSPGRSAWTIPTIDLDCAYHPSVKGLTIAQQITTATKGVVRSTHPVKVTHSAVHRLFVTIGGAVKTGKTAFETQIATTGKRVTKAFATTCQAVQRVKPAPTGRSV